MDQNTKRTLWIVGGAVLLIALVAHHNITSGGRHFVLWSSSLPSFSTKSRTGGWPDSSETTRLRGLDASPSTRWCMSIRWERSSCRRCWPWVGSVCSVGPSRCPSTRRSCVSPRNQGVLVVLGRAVHQCAPGRSAADRLHRRLSLQPSSKPVRFHSRRRSCSFSAWAISGSWRSIWYRSPRSTVPCSSSACLPARYWPTYLRIRPYTMAIIMGLVLLNFYLGAHGPITVAFDHLYNWWAGVLYGGN